MDLVANSRSTKQGGRDSQSQEQWVQEVLKVENNGSSFPAISRKVSSISSLVSIKLESSTTM